MVFRGELDVKIQGCNTNYLRIFSNLDLIYEQFTQNPRLWKGNGSVPISFISPNQNNLTIFRLSLKRQKRNQPLKSCKQKNPTVSPTYLLEKRFFPNRWWWATGHLLGSQPPAFPEPRINSRSIETPPAKAHNSTSGATSKGW